MSTDVEELLIERVRELEPQQQQRVLEFVEGLVGKVRTGESIWEKIKERVKNVPPEAWADVPSDGSINLDHYLYGAPKK
jgi:hypothetical protein